MMNNFYDDPLNVIKLIKEINRITNSKMEYIELAEDYAPLAYIYGKCYYFAYALSHIIPGSQMYMITKPLHVITCIGGYYYDANGIYEVYTTGTMFILNLNSAADRDYIHSSVANSFDDKYLLPIVLQIAQEADSNVRLSENKNSHYIRKKV